MLSWKTAGPISAEFGVLMHNGPPYPKGYKSIEIANKTANKNVKNII